MRRPRNLAAVLIPYAALVPAALAIGRVAPDLAAGAVVLALAPAELAAPALARAVGSRMETAAAVMTGTLVLSLVVLTAALGVAGTAAVINTAIVAFVAGTALASAVPTVRDALLPVLRGASYVALGVLIVAAVVQGVPSLLPETLLAATVLIAVGALATSLVVALFGGDWRALAVGGATRDFAVAATLAAGSAGGPAAALPLAYGAGLFVLFAIAMLAARSR